MKDVTGMAEDRRGTKPTGSGLFTFLLAALTAAALVHVAVRFEGLEVAYALGHERKVGADLEEQRRRLQIEIGMLKDPDRVVSIARDTLKMGPPPPEAIRRVGTGSLLAGDAETAPPEPRPTTPPESPAPTPSPMPPRGRETAVGER